MIGEYLLVVAILTDAIVTYLLFRKIRDYGYPRWYVGEISRIYYPYFQIYGLEKGIIYGCLKILFIAICVVEIIKFIVTQFFNEYPVLVTIAHITIIILFFGGVFINLKHYRKDPSLYDQKVLGTPVKPP